MKVVRVSTYNWLIFKYDPPYFPWKRLGCWGKEHQLGVLAMGGPWEGPTSPVPIPCSRCGKWCRLSQAHWDVSVVNQVRFIQKRGMESAAR